MNRARVLAGFGAVAVLVAALPATVGASTVTTSNGTWEAYPGQSTSYATSVQQPINADGSSNFKSNGKAVIPVKFGLSTGTGPLVFESIGGDANTDNDFSFLSFTPAATLTASQITGLSAAYAFTLGDCHGGSLRWQIRTSATEALFIYYGNAPQFGNGGTGGCTPASPGGIDQSNANLIGLGDLRYDTSQYLGGTFYDTYAHAMTLMGSLPIVRTSLILDSGWGGDQRLTLSSATVATTSFTDTFTPSPSTATSPTCALPTTATIKITKTAGTPTGDVNEPVTIQPNDDNGIFRVVDCKLMYNLATSSLSGVGTYKVFAVIDGVQAANPATFDLK
jgi:hypothetical protein